MSESHIPLLLLLGGNHISIPDISLLLKIGAIAKDEYSPSDVIKA